MSEVLDVGSLPAHANARKPGAAAQLCGASGALLRRVRVVVAGRLAV